MRRRISRGQHSHRSAKTFSYARGKPLKKRSYADRRFVYEPSSPKKDWEVFLRRYHYAAFFPKEMLAAAEAHALHGKQELKNAKQVRRLCQTQNRLNLSDLPVITIDGAGAKDYDDGVYVQKDSAGFRLDVHVADVSHYIPKESPLDLEAKKRGTSVYLLNKVLPMLPSCFSNDLCSLREGSYRLTLLCRMYFDFEGRLRSYRFHRSVIRPRRRLTYQVVQDALDQKQTPLDLEPAIKQQLRHMQELQGHLHQKRLREGSITFHSDTLAIHMEDDAPVKIGIQPRLSSEGLIEEFMLMANWCAADFIREHHGIYRVHESPDPTKLDVFHTLVSARGYSLKAPRQRHALQTRKSPYQAFFESLTSPVELSIFSKALLISMKQAHYASKNRGHYGLSFKKYCHFTSPIRRYPDLVVHRIIKDILTDHIPRYTKKEVDFIAQQSSLQERKADEAEKEYRRLTCMRYLSQRPQQHFEVMIVGMSAKGLFVQDIETGIEGMISDIHYTTEGLFDESTWEIRNRQGKVMYRMGQRLMVRLDALNYKRMFIDFFPF